MKSLLTKIVFLTTIILVSILWSVSGSGSRLYKEGARTRSNNTNKQLGRNNEKRTEKTNIQIASTDSSTPAS
jgi:hypothetical protein